jgi:hypothetical protein
MMNDEMTSTTESTMNAHSRSSSLTPSSGQSTDREWRQQQQQQPRCGHKDGHGLDDDDGDDEVELEVCW